MEPGLVQKAKQARALGRVNSAGPCRISLIEKSYGLRFQESGAAHPQRTLRWRRWPQSWAVAEAV